MAIAKKHKRTLVYGDSTYYWWVKRDDDYDRPVLHIASEDKGLIVLYPTEQHGERQYLVSIGRVFKNRTTSGCWQRAPGRSLTQARIQRKPTSRLWKIFLLRLDLWPAFWAGASTTEMQRV